MVTENRDLTLETPYGRLNLRTCLLVYKEDQILLEEVSNPDWGAFYCLPGGRVSFGESSLDAAVREIGEELCLDVTADSLELAALVENFFRNDKLQKDYHENSYFYRLSVPEDFTPPTHERDGRPINLAFHALDNLDDLLIYPLILKEKLVELQSGLHHYINRENDI